MLTFNTDGMVAQRFSFPAPIMNYILKNLQPQHLVKLYQCCKFFYAKYRQNIIRNLVIVDDGKPETFDPNTTIIRASNSALEKLKDFWICDSFIYRAPFNYDFIIPKFSQCIIKKLEACDSLIWKEYEALTKAGTVKELKIGQVIRTDGDHLHVVSIDKIIAAVPNAKSIEITRSILALTSFASLAALNHQVKITEFVLHNIYEPENFNLDLLFEFLNKYADLDCKVYVDFDVGGFIGDERINELKRMGIEYRNVIAARLEEKKKELAREESAFMP